MKLISPVGLVLYLIILFDNCPEKKGKESTFQETGTDPTYVQINSTGILRTYK